MNYERDPLANDDKNRDLARRLKENGPFLRRKEWAEAQQPDDEFVKGLEERLTQAQLNSLSECESDNQT